MLYEEQMHWIQTIQRIRSPIIDGFFKAWNLVDSLYFVVLLIILAWYLLDRKLGIRLFYLLTISFVVNKFFKCAFMQPRPCHLDPSVGVLCFSSYGFPSGAAQTATLIFGLVCLEYKRLLYRWIAFIFALFLCFSRLYLGVHYLSDIAGGIVVGCFLLILYKWCFPIFEKYWKVSSLAFPFFLLSLGLFVSSPWLVYLFFSTLGFSMGLMCFAKQGTIQKGNLSYRSCQALFIIIGVIVLFVCRFLLPSFSLVIDFMQGYWISFLGGQAYALIRQPS